MQGSQRPLGKRFRNIFQREGTLYTMVFLYRISRFWLKTKVSSTSISLFFCILVLLCIIWLFADFMEFTITFDPEIIAKLMLKVAIFLYILKLATVADEEKYRHKKKGYIRSAFDNALHVIRLLAWRLRLVICAWIAYKIVKEASLASPELIAGFSDGRLLPAVGVILAPLVAAVTLLVRKEIEISKLRERWVSELREKIADYCSLCRGYVNDSALAANVFIILNNHKDKEENGSSLIPEINKQYYEAANMKRDIDRKVVFFESHIEMALNRRTNTIAKEIMGCVRNIKNMRELSGKLHKRYMRIRNKEQYYGYTKKYIDILRKEIRSESASIVNRSNRYFDEEWDRIKGFDKEIKASILSISFLMFGIAFGYLVIALRAASVIS